MLSVGSEAAGSTPVFTLCIHNVNVGIERYLYPRHTLSRHSGPIQGQTGLFENFIKLQFVKSEGWGMENWLLKDVSNVLDHCALVKSSGINNWPDSSLCVTITNMHLTTHALEAHGEGF